MAYKTKYKADYGLPDTTELALVKETPFGECWLWGEGVGENAQYLVVHNRVDNHFNKWFSTNHIDIVNNYIEPNQFTLDFGFDETTKDQENE